MTASSVTPLSDTRSSEPGAPWPLSDERWRQRRNLDRLLLDLMDDMDVAATLQACGVVEHALRYDLAARDAAGGLLASIRRLPGRFSGRGAPDDDDAQSIEVERSIARASIRAQASHCRAVSATDLLLAILDETGSAASQRLQRMGLTRFDAQRFVSHGLAKGQPDPQLSKTGEDGPRLVCILNDDFTPMDFVVEVLERFFAYTKDDASRIMGEIHRDGSGVVATLDRDAAFTKAEEVTNFGRDHQFVLRCVVADPSSEREGAHAELLT